MQTNKKMFVHAKPSEADSNNVQRRVDYTEVLNFCSIVKIKLLVC